MSTPLEIEIKLPVTNLRAMRAKVRRLGFTCSQRRTFESNVLLDTETSALRQQAMLLRIREAGNVCTLTFKGSPQTSRHKIREEIETTVTSASALQIILTRLGFVPGFRYEKYRTE